ncbi:MAG: GntR family transcriptional regulator [Desulfobacterales bacterium]
MLHNTIFEIIRDRIVFGQYPPGMSLSEKALCKEFGVSRTPLREAIQKLVSLKLVTVIPRFGTHVTQIDIHEIRSAFEVKIRLEGLAGELAAMRVEPDQLEELDGLIKAAVRGDQTDKNRRHNRLIEIDSRFHTIIHQAAQNPILQEFLDNLHYRCARLWNSSLNDVVPNAEIIDQLRSVYNALERKDPESARKHMERHVQYFIDEIKKRLL